MKEYLQSKTFQITISIVGALVVLFVVFQAGMFVGFNKAGFLNHFGDNYVKNFDQRRGMPPMNQMFGGPLPEAHGVTGKIVSINLPTIIVEGKDGIEKTILINNETSIKKFRDSINVSELKTDEFIVVLGTPNDNAQITAKLIRVMPEPPITPENNQN